MAAHDPPWRFDPLKNLVGVGWGTGLVTIGFEYRFQSSSTSGAPPAWDAFYTPDTDVRGLRGASLLDELGPVVTPPGPPPITPPPGVVAQNDFWCYPRNKSDDTTTDTQTFHVVDIGRYVIFTNLGTITEYSDAAAPSEHLVPFRIDANSTIQITGGGGGDNTLGAKADGFDAFLRAYMEFVVERSSVAGATTISAMLSEEITSHDEVRTVTTTVRHARTVTFLNLGRIVGNDAAIKSAGVLRVAMQMQGVTSKQFLEWQVGAQAWTGARKFTPSDFSPTFVEPVGGGASIDAKVEELNRLEERTQPAVEVSFEIDLKTKKITSEQHDL